jgi:2-polyprenyl-3-methyl-5-hydroxy-6-metoxy-1,4-benzoquinol methylase
MPKNAKAPYKPLEWETVPCPFCGSEKSSAYERFGSELQFTYVLCSNCSLVYQSPRPKYDQHFIDAAYAEYYQFADNLELSDLADVRESSVMMFKKEVDHIIQYDKKRTGVLDIGSGMGTFLFAAKSYYKTVIGLDVSAQMAAFVEKELGVKIFVQQFENFSHPEKFSLIHMSHVLEHVPDPNHWLQKAKEMLDAEGILVINVPNKFSISFRLQHLFTKLGIKKQFSDSWKDPSRTPDHLFEPTVKSMKYLLQKNNYEVLEHYTYSRRDPASNGSLFSKVMNRWLKVGSNITFISRPERFKV